VANTWYNVETEKKAKSGLDYGRIKELFKFKIGDHQTKAFHYYETVKNDNGLRGGLIDGKTGTGKDLQKDTTVYRETSNGEYQSVRICDLHAGDRILNPDFRFVRVMSKHNKHKRQMYRVLLDDGTSLLAGIEHQFGVCVNGEKNIVLTTRDLIRLMQDDELVFINAPIKDTKRYYVDNHKTGKLFNLLQMLRKMDGDKPYMNKMAYVSEHAKLLKKYGIISKEMEFQNDEMVVMTNVVDITSDGFTVKSTHDLKNSIVSVTREGIDDSVCITVDSDDEMFLAGDFIPTHNTFMSLAISEALHARRIFIVCPKPTVMDPWVSSVTEELYKRPQESYVISANNKKRYKNERIIICNYESLNKAISAYTDYKSEDMVMLIDESHNFTTMKSKRTEELIELTDLLNADDVILLSGTPIKFRADEMAPMLHLIDKRFKGNVTERFKELYKSPNGLLTGTIQERFNANRVLIEKDNLGLPKKFEEMISVEMKGGELYTLEAVRERMKEFIKTRTNELEIDKQQYIGRYESMVEKYKDSIVGDKEAERKLREYTLDVNTIIKAEKAKKLHLLSDVILKVNQYEKKVIETYLRGEDLKTFRECKTVVKYISLKVNGECLSRVVMRSRIDAGIEMAKNIDYDTILNSVQKKGIIFSSYTEVCESAVESVRELGFRPLDIYGDNTKDLSGMVKEFMEDKRANPIVSTYKSLSTGVRLTDANVMLLIDLPFRSYIENQTIGRIHRIGQDEDVWIYKFKLDTGEEYNIVDRNVDILQWSKEQVSRITGDDIEEVDVSTESMKEQILIDWESYATPWL